MTYKKILVTLDGSPLAEAVLPHVEEMERRNPASAVYLGAICNVLVLRRRLTNYYVLNLGDARTVDLSMTVRQIDGETVDQRVYKGIRLRAGRTVRSVAAVQALWADREEDAYAIRDLTVAGADPVAIENWAGELGIESGSFDDTPLEAYAFGAGCLSLVGTAETVAQGLLDLYEAGVDGVMFCFDDYLRDTKRVSSEIVPLLREAGIARAPALEALERRGG